MQILRTLHLAVVFSWLGLVMGETVMEYLGRRQADFRQAVAHCHFWIDIFLEMPLVTLVFGTGALLLAQSPTDLNLWLKVSMGMVAILANLYCSRMVFDRRNFSFFATAGSDREWMSYSRTYFILLGIGFPFGIGALLMGLRRGGLI